MSPTRTRRAANADPAETDDAPDDAPPERAVVEEPPPAARAVDRRRCADAVALLRLLTLLLSVLVSTATLAVLLR
jgi:hypothetical protein